MSIFTMSLGEAIELHGVDNIGLTDYPVISESYRTRLNKLIVDQYLNREIGQESFSLFRHAMKRKMDQIMPVYNELYATKTLIVDPLRTVDLRTLSTTDTDETASTDTDMTSFGTSSQESSSTSTSRQVGSDTPQMLLSGEGDYASNAADGRSDASASAGGTENANSVTGVDAARNVRDVMDSTTTGFQGSQADLVLAYRQTIINIDMLIVDELAPLFMGVWNNGDSYFNRRYY